MSCIQAIDFDYFKTTYFWVTTGIAVFLAACAAWSMDRAEK